MMLSSRSRGGGIKMDNEEMLPLGATVRILATGEAGRIFAWAEWPDWSYLVNGEWYDGEDLQLVEFAEAAQRDGSQQTLH